MFPERGIQARNDNANLESLDDAIEIANGTDFGLAAGIFTRGHLHCISIAHRLETSTRAWSIRSTDTRTPAAAAKAAPRTPCTCWRSSRSAYRWSFPCNYIRKPGDTCRVHVFPNDPEGTRHDST
ncbi:hypothetical protein BS297_11695 [Rhodococcus erythropolis]|uniref:Aldehyde dehydrogenase domain-containing protein n=1 Tax=Rhodococcus erythropolis TaxID=1833 RepID=A0A5N5E7E7_RHOER|nr:hypothetical protein BS297_11695 [Rhodococcus erythropolis]